LRDGTWAGDFDGRASRCGKAEGVGKGIGESVWEFDAKSVQGESSLDNVLMMKRKLSMLNDQ